MATDGLPMYIHASEICVDDEGKSIGNGIFAGRDYKAGEVVSGVTRPMVASLDTERLEDTCANCYAWTEGSSIGTRLYVPEGTKISKCAGCRMVGYCSKKCQKEAWSRVHKHECKNLQPLASKDIPKAVRATMELLIRRKQGLITDPAWKILCDLEDHVDDFKQSGKYGEIELMAMGAARFSMSEQHFSIEDTATMYARVLSNSLTLITPTLDPLGIILDPYLGHINHSCDPNAYVTMDGAQAFLHALAPIKKDEEIYISYIDTTNPFPRRQSELKARWFFACKCKKCQKGATLDEDKFALLPKNVAKTHKDVADLIIEHEDFATDPASYVGESKDEKRVAAIQAKIFAMYEEEQCEPDPAAAIALIQDGMRLCHQSNLWSVYRQPFAALRDDLIVNMLSVNNYQLAWAQCAKRYKHILPVQYPLWFHPVRVVQIWQMAMLAAYIADTGGIAGGAPEINMGLIAMMLTKQVVEFASYSHGPESSFTKSVQEKADEMSQELRRKLGNKSNAVMDEELQMQAAYLDQMGDWIQY